ncbi:MAG: sulfurtransferase, partial [Candidatus Neomarinimicrobiota bacterium]
MKKTYDFCIIGAGSIGLPLSYYLSEKGVAVVVIDMLVSPGRGQNRSAIGGIRATHSDNAKIKICKESIRIISNFKDEHGIEVDWIQGGYLFPVYDEMIERDLKSILDFQKSCGLNIDWVGPKDVGELVPGIN